jgi:hypothetical protein
MAIITLSTYKTLVGISGTSQDTRISAIIPYVQDDIVETCHYDFLDDEGAEDWPAALVMIAAEMITYRLNSLSGNAAMKSESVEGWSYTKEDVGGSGYPTAIEKSLRKYIRLSIKTPQVMSQYRDRRMQSPSQILSDNPSYDVPGYPLEEAEA